MIIIGLIIAPWGRKYSLIMDLAGVIGITLVASARLILVGSNGPSNIKVITLPPARETRWMNALIDEQDSLIFGEAIFNRMGGDTPREHEQITAALHTAYSEMRRTRRIFASPFLSTYLNLQQPGAFDAVIIEPEIMQQPEVGVIFLHGYMGNVTAQCWEIAQAVGKLRATTVCPSTDWTGQWWKPTGQAILQSTFRYLRQQGIEKFYLGGFSNGGFAISRLSPAFRKEDGLSGLFFINGISGGVSLRGTGLPILIIQGAQDERVPAQEVRRIAGAIGDSGTYVELEGDHFLIMKQPGLVQNIITGWLEDREADQ